MSIAVQGEPTGLIDVHRFRVPITHDITLTDHVTIPAGIVDLSSFREWCQSDQFPEFGRIDYSRGTIIVDLSMEQLYDHNQVKAAITATLFFLASRLKLGRVFQDGVRLVMPVADRSTEPDLLMVTFDSFRSNRVREIPGRQHGLTEFEGAPDLVVEVVSDSSEQKDGIELPELYYDEGVLEYWRVDARCQPLKFDVFWRGENGFELAAPSDNWRHSLVFNQWFMLCQSEDEMGKPYFELRHRE